jgi:hypothetical protein
MKGAYKNDIKQLTSLSTFAFSFTIGFILGILHQPLVQLDIVIEEIRRLMMEEIEKVANNKRKMIRREPTVVEKQKQQGRGADGKLQIQIWDPRGSQPQ